MDRTTYLKHFKQITDTMYQTTVKKNSDYAQSSDPFSNFKLVELLNVCDTQTGIITRMTDKLSRLSNLLKNKASNEPIEDSILDLAVYCVILLVYRRSLPNPQEEQVDEEDLVKYIIRLDTRDKAMQEVNAIIKQIGFPYLKEDASSAVTELTVIADKKQESMLLQLIKTMPSNWFGELKLIGFKSFQVTEDELNSLRSQMQGVPQDRASN